MSSLLKGLKGGNAGDGSVSTTRDGVRLGRVPSLERSRRKISITQPRSEIPWLAHCHPKHRHFRPLPETPRMQLSLAPAVPARPGDLQRVHRRRFLNPRCPRGVRRDVGGKYPTADGRGKISRHLARTYSHGPLALSRPCACRRGCDGSREWRRGHWRQRGRG